MKWQNGICFHARNKIGFFSRAIHKTKIIEKKLIFHETKRNFSQHLHLFHSNWNAQFHFFLLLFSLFILLSLSSFFFSLTQEKKETYLLFFFLSSLKWCAFLVRRYGNEKMSQNQRASVFFALSCLVSRPTMSVIFAIYFTFFCFFARKPSKRNQKCKFLHTHSHQSLIKWQQ